LNQSSAESFPSIPHQLKFLLIFSTQLYWLWSESNDIFHTFYPHKNVQVTLIESSLGRERSSPLFWQFIGWVDTFFSGEPLLCMNVRSDALSFHVWCLVIIVSFKQVAARSYRTFDIFFHSPVPKLEKKFLERKRKKFQYTSKTSRKHFTLADVLMKFLFCLPWAKAVLFTFRTKFSNYSDFQCFLNEIKFFFG
jgi:hypothetical protein